MSTTYLLLHLVMVASLGSCYVVPSSRATGGEIGVGTVFSGLVAEVNDVSAVFDAVLSEITTASPTATPTAISDATSAIADIFSAEPTNLVNTAIQLIQKGLGPGELENIYDALSDAANSENNVNPDPPQEPIYPQAAEDDPIYEKNETQLRGAISIP